MENIRVEKVFAKISKEYTKVMGLYWKDIERIGASDARRKWDETIIALESIVEEFDYKMVYHKDTATTTIERY